jgi:hypothetical protein
VYVTLERERRQLEAAGPLVPRVIAASPDHGALALEPVHGLRLDSLDGFQLAGAL